MMLNFVKPFSFWPLFWKLCKLVNLCLATLMMLNFVMVFSFWPLFWKLCKLVNLCLAALMMLNCVMVLNSSIESDIGQRTVSVFLVFGGFLVLKLLWFFSFSALFVSAFSLFMLNLGAWFWGLINISKLCWKVVL